MSHDDTTQPPQGQVRLLVNQHGLISGVRFTKQTPDVVFGDPEVVRIKPSGEVVIAEGANLDDAALAFWHAITEWRSTASRPTLADAQPGGRVRLGGRATQEMVDAGASALLAYRKSGGDYTVHPTHAAEAAINAALSVRRCCGGDRCAGHSALSAQPSPGETLPPEMRLGSPDYLDYLDSEPSPGGQGDALLESLVARWRNHAEEIGVSDNLLCQKIANCTMRHAAELQAVLAARQPVSAEDWSRSMAEKEAGQYVGAGAHGIPDEAAARQPVGEPVEMSPEFTDTARAAIAWVLWHHQGGSSPVGQPLRFALGMGQHDRMTDYQIAEAKRFAAWAGATTEGFHRRDPAQAVDLGQFRPAVCAMGLYAEEPEDVDEAKRLLALIDSQAVRNG